MDSPASFKHFLAIFKVNGITIGEDTEFHFSLYSMERQAFTHEDFVLSYGVTGLPFNNPIGPVDSQDAFPTVFKVIYDIQSSLMF